MSCFRNFRPGGCRALYLASKRKHCWHMILRQFHALELQRVAPPLDMMQLIGPRQKALEAFETTNQKAFAYTVYVCLPILPSLVLTDTEYRLNTHTFPNFQAFHVGRSTFSLPCDASGESKLKSWLLRENSWQSSWHVLAARAYIVWR